MARVCLEVGRRQRTLAQKIRGISWGLVLLVGATACFGIAVLYSAADGNMQPWAAKQLMRFAIGLLPMIAAALLDIRHWYRVAYWVYAGALVLVVAVDVRGFVGMGAQRWIDLGLIQLQPSDLLNLPLMLSLARYFHPLRDDGVGRIAYLILPALIILIPAASVLQHPDLLPALI